MPRTREIYTLPEANHPLTEEELAVALAKTSRSPESFRDIAAKLREDDASKFHDKYVLGYGHASVAEFAMGAFCFENVSIVASKVLESMGRPAAAEKSTRYQKFDADAVYIPASSDVDQERASNLLKFLFTEYNFFTEQLMLFAEKKVPQDAKNRAGAVKGRAFDSARYLLPAGTQTNLALRINALDIPRLIGTLLISPHQELVDIGNELKATALKVLPTLIKYAHPDEYDAYVTSVISELTNYDEDEERISPTYRYIGGEARKIISQKRNEGYEDIVTGTSEVVLTNWSATMIEDILSALLCRSPSNLSKLQAMQIVHEMSPKGRLEFLGRVTHNRGQFDPVPKEFQAAHLTYDIKMDYGAYRDLQRHRRCTQIPQMLSLRDGFSVPDDIYEIGLGQRYVDTVNTVSTMINNLDCTAYTQEYFTPLAALHRTIYDMDVREHFYIVELRSKPQGHFSYRRIVNMMQECFYQVCPDLAKYVRCVPMDGIGVHS